jgi:GT2 family glycosyltransferase
MAATSRRAIAGVRRATDGFSPLSPTLHPVRRRAGRRLEAMWAVGASVQAPKVERRPMLSILTPVHDGAASDLDDLLRSFRAQTPGLAELVICDDGSTRPETRAWLDARAGEPDVAILRRESNGGIAAATNDALAAARAPWIGFLDQDDMLAPHALANVLRALADRPTTRFLYTDEAVVDSRRRPVSIFLKPAFDPVLLSGVNYVNHLAVYERDRIVALGGVSTGLDGSQDYDLVLRYCRGLESEEIAHLPYPAYIWRRRPGSFSDARLDEATANARSALSRRFTREDRKATVEPVAGADHLHRVRFPRREQDWPHVTAIIPNRDSPDLISETLDGLLARTRYPKLDVLVVDNGSEHHETLALYHRLAKADPRFSHEIRPEPFNFSAMVNRALARATGDHVLLLNNDIEVLEPDWLREMVECMSFDGVGVVGARLLFPNGRLQHAGVVVGLGGLAGHWYYKAPSRETGRMSRLLVRNGMTAVTGACMLISRECLDRVGDFDQQRFRVAYNDIDFCIRARRAGFGVVWTPFATLRHHESASRGSDKLLRNRARFRKEQDALRETHATDAFEDPCFSPWWSRFRSRPRIKLRETPPPARRFMGGGS